MIFALNQETGGLGLNKNFLGQFKKTYVPQQSYESALPIIQEYNRLVAEGADAQAYANQQDTGFRNYFITDLKSGEATLVGYSDSVKKLNADYKAMSFSAKAAALGTQVLNTALSMGAALLLSWGLEQLIGVLDRYVRSDEIAIDKANELADSWSKASDQISNNKKSLDSISDEYSKLSKGVDQYGNNLSLTSDEYARYHDLANQIANISPDLVSSWDKENNAVLKVKGSVEDLNKAFDDTVRKHNELVVSQAKDLFSGLTSSVANNPILPWQSTGSKLKKDYASEIISSIGSGATKSAIEDLIFSKGQQTQVLMDVLKESGITESKLPFGAAQVGGYADALMKNVDALKSYVSSLEITSSVSESGFQDLAKSYLALSKDFDVLPDNAKTAINSVVTNFNADFLSQFSGENGEGKFYKWIDDNLVSGFKDVDLSGILNAKSLFDSSKISVSNYKTYANNFAKQISGMAPEVQDVLNDTFSPDTEALENNVKEKLLDAYDNSVGSLTLDQLKIASNLQLDGTALLTWDQLIQKINEAKTVTSQSIESMSASIKTLSDEYTVLNSALTEQSGNGYVSYETYKKLIEANSAYASSFINVNGQLMLNAKTAQETADATAQLTLAEAESAQASKQAEYDEVAEKLADVNEQLQKMDDLGYQNNLYDSLMDQRDALEGQQDALAKELQQYQSITSQIKGMTSAYYEYLQAKDTPNQDAEYDQFKGAKKIVKDTLSAKGPKKTGTDDFQSAVNLILGGTSEGLSPKEKQARYKQALEKYNRYVTDDYKGADNFLKDLVKNKLATKNGKTISLNEGTTGDQIAKSLGISVDTVKSLIGDLETYEGEFDWGKLFSGVEPLDPMDIPTNKAAKEIEKSYRTFRDATDYKKHKDDIQPNTPVYTGGNIDQGAQNIEDSATKFQKIAEESAGKIYSAHEVIDAALAGKKPPTAPVTPTTPTGGYNGGTTTTTTPVSSAENRRNEGISSGTTKTVVVPIPQQTVDLVLNVSTEELARISGVIKTGVDGEIPITADPTEASTALTALGLEIQNLPGATVTVSLVDPNGAIHSVTTLSDAIDLIKQGAAANVSVSFNPADSSAQVSALSDGLDKVNQGANATITTDTGDSQAKVQAVAGEIDKVQDKTAVIDADTTYIPGDVEKANSELEKVGDKTAEITADASTIPDTVSTANDELAKLQNKTVTVTTIYKTEGDSNGGGGSGGKGVITDNSGSSTDTSKDSGGKSGGAGGGRKSGLSSSSDSQAVPTDNFKEADAQLNPLLALLLSIKNAWDNLWNRGPVPDLIEPTGIDNLNTAKATLDDIQNENIDPKKMSLDPQTAYSQNYVLEQRLGQSVTKIVKIKTEEQSNAKGTKNAKPGVSLVDEEGAEVIEHADGTFEIGTDKGPRLTVLQRGDVVHTAKESKNILRRGISAVKGFLGNRFADGSPGSIYWDTPSGNSTPNTSSSKKNTKGVNWKKYIDKLFDWIEIRLKRLQTVTDKWKKQIEDAVGYLAKNKATDSAVSAMTDQINALNAAYNHYMEQANTVAKKTKLPQNIINSVQNGTIDISSYDSKTQEKIKAYQEWWEKAQDVKDQIEDIKDEQEELIHQKMDNIINQYKDLTDVIDAASEKAKANIEYKKATGKEVTAADYQPEINAQVQKIATMQDEYNKLKAEFDKQLADGTLVKGSEAYYQYLDQLNDLDTEIINSKTDLAGLNDEVRQLALTNLNNVLNNFKAVQSSIQGTLDLIQAQGRIVTTDVYKQLIQNGMQQIANLQQQNDLLKQQQQGLDKNSDKYQEIQQQLDSNAETINGIKVSQEEWNDSILDLRIDELNRMKDALSKTNDEYERQKDLQQAIEDLERAKSQRKIRILENGTFKYVADTQDVADKQRALDQKLHEEDMAQIDKVIDAIEDLKESNNVYADQGLSKTTLNDLFPGATLDDILQGVLASAKAGVSLAELADTMSSTATALMQTNNRTGNVTVSPNAIVINTTSADPEEIAKYTLAKLSTEMSSEISQLEYE